MTEAPRATSYDQLAICYDWPAILAQTLASVLATGIAAGCTWLFPSLAAPWGGVSLGPWLLLGVSTALLIATRLVLHTRPDRFPIFYVLGTLSQTLWLLLLCWQSALPIQILAALQASVWIEDDARLLSPPGLVRLGWGLSVPVFLAFLFLFDLVGHGWLSAFSLHAPLAFAWLITLAVTALLFWWRLQFLQTRQSALDALHAQIAAARKSRDRLEVERRVVQSLGGLLAPGLSLGRFGHDVASPVQVLLSGSEDLHNHLADTPSPLTHAEAVRITKDMIQASQTIATLTSGLARAARTPGASTGLAVRDVLETARLQVFRELAARNIPAPTLHISAPDAIVIGTDGYTSVIANLTVNAALIHPDQHIRWEGECGDRRYYLRIVDQGARGEARERAIRTVQARLDLVNAPLAEDRAEYRGFGVGLLLARLEVLRHGGDLTVESNGDKPGLTLCLHLPLQEGDELSLLEE